MIEEVDAVIALPGGSGTIEELLEALSWKRLGLYVNPIVIVNQAGYFDALLRQFRYRCGGTLHGRTPPVYVDCGAGGRRYARRHLQRVTLE
jgi:predicted Rossmann-fold nucleotide-binding protein